MNFLILDLIPLGVGIPLGFITPTEKSDFDLVWEIPGELEFP